MMRDRDRGFDERSGKPYNSFLLRCWHVGESELRIKLEHIQSGDSTQESTYEAAVAWLSNYCARGAHGHPALGARGSLAEGESRT